MLRHRLVSGPVMILLAVLGAWIDAALDRAPAPWDHERTLPPGIIVAPTVLVLSLLAARELARILRGAGIQASTSVTCGVAMLGVVIAALVPGTVSGVTGAAVVSFAVGLVLVGTMIYTARHKQVQGMIAAAGGSLLSFSLLGLMLGFIVTLRREHEVWVLLWVLLVTKSSDIGAYTLGRAIGKRKLIGWLSPGKTWEGLFGAVLFAAILGAIGAVLMQWAGVAGSPDPVWGAGLGVLFACIGQLGDLVASALKRDAGRKDAGTAVPGFGGVLDVIDSLFLAPPIAYWLLPLAAAWPAV
ncbi:MAG: phosphatidate cytidylyltransferase [Phycisphaeraceae bacterium]|nr:MAG: phosphatidate cytidylyltransferase [Phycisphaeraceae bacterium]